MNNIFKINGINTFAAKSRTELLDLALEHKKILIALNAEKILNSTAEMKLLMNNNIVYPDGIGAVLALRKRGCKGVVKIPGCELWLDIIKRFYEEKTFYLVGAKDVVIEDVIVKLKSEFSGINILAYRNGFIKNDEDEKKLINDIAIKKPDIVFVAMGSPKQELLMQKMRDRHKAIYQGLGGSFDVYVGNVKRAPKFWIKINLEWAYRLFLQPSRLKRQYKLFFFVTKLIRNEF